MNRQNVINGQPQLALRQELVATVGTTATLLVNVFYPGFLLELTDIATATASKHLILKLSGDGGATFLDLMDYSVNYFATVAATTFTNLNATGVTDIRVGPDLDDAGGVANINFYGYGFAIGNRAPVYEGSFVQDFAGPPVTAISGLIWGIRRSVAVQPNAIQISLDDGTSTWGGTVRVYELVGA